MVRLLTRLKAQSDRLAVAFIAWRFVLLIEAAITSVFSYLAAAAVKNVKCAGMHMIADYRSELLDFWALPCMSLLTIVLFTNKSQRARITEVAQNYKEPGFRLGPIQITFGEKVFYCAAILLIIALGGAMVWAVTRYQAFVDYCGTIATPHSS
jgi:hypothetical protein